VSAIALDMIRQKISVPVVGVVPAIKQLRKFQRQKKLRCLLRLRPFAFLTFKSLFKICQRMRNYFIGSSKLVQIAEDKMAGKLISLDDVRQECKNIENPALDTIILGCTHFPLLKEELKCGK